MRILFLLISCLIFIRCTNAQSDKRGIVGIWQADSEIESDAWLDCYQFFPDGKFSFKFNQYDESRRVISIDGTYRIDNDTIFLMIKSSKELSGGYFYRNPLTTFADSWSIADANTITTNYSESGEELLIIKECNSNYSKPCILLDGRQYYLMKTNPSDY